MNLLAGTGLIGLIRPGSIWSRVRYSLSLVGSWGTSVRLQAEAGVSTVGTVGTRCDDGNIGQGD